MTVRPVFLDAVDAVELGELLQFLRCWLDCDGEGVAGSFGRFVGDGGYGIAELRADLCRFGFLLGSEHGEWLLGGDER